MIVMPSIDWENDALCDVCTRGFTHAEWENRHTEEKTGGDVHDYCCELCAPNEIEAKNVSDETFWTDHEDDNVVVDDYYRNAVVGVIRKVADRSWGDDRRMVTLDVDDFCPTVRVRVFVTNYEDALILVGRTVAVVGDHLYRIG